jgi:uncharacterized cofD-like protein
VVAVGGGHGLAATLAAARTYAGEVTAVVSVADDGGSTGRLRAAEPRPAPGDLRKCLIALAASSSPLLDAMDHRFGAGELEGHAFGNLLIAALEETTGDLVGALDEIGRLLGCVGRVLPATTVPVELRGTVPGGEVVQGQVSVSERPDVRWVSVEPADAPACADAVAAVERADQVVLGPGSLFTSVLAATAVAGVRDAVAAASAAGRVVYVCNLRPQLPETAGFGVADHVAALHRHGIRPSVVLHDSGALGGAEGVAGAVGTHLAAPGAAAHDPELLGEALASLAARRTERA